MMIMMDNPLQHYTMSCTYKGGNFFTVYVIGLLFESTIKISSGVELNVDDHEPISDIEL